MSDSDPIRTVMCSRLEKELPAIQTRIGFVGEFGEQVLATVSQDAWSEWLEMQIKVINEYRLHMGDPAHRKVLAEAAAKFFKFDGGDGTLDGGPEGGLN